jgi:hypothetical protein
LTLLVWIAFALTLGGGSLLLALAMRRFNAWSKNAGTARVPADGIQLTFWIVLMIFSIVVFAVGNSFLAVVVLLLAQLLPRKTKIASGLAVP